MTVTFQMSKNEKKTSNSTEKEKVSIKMAQKLFAALQFVSFYKSISRIQNVHLV